MKDFKTKAVTDKEGHHLMIKGSIQKDNYKYICSQIRGLKYIKQTLTDRNAETSIAK